MYSTMKLRRRRCKYQNIIMRDYGLTLSEFPTKAIMVCNGGLVNGVDEGMIFNTFQPYGQIESIIMLHGKSYCFVLFKETTSSAAAYNDVNNKKLWPLINGPVFLAFVEKIPDSLNDNLHFDERPPGLYVIENFISEEDECLILQCIKGELSNSEEIKSSALKNRRVSHFGYEFKYSNNNVDVNEPIRSIPKMLDFLWDRLLEFSSKIGLNKNFKPDQLTVNNYKPGQGIPAHVDTHSAFEDPIVSLSLESSLVMEFKNLEGKCCHVLLPERSLCIMSGEARYGWTHGIATRKSDIIPTPEGGLTLQMRKERTSLTFRKIKKQDCKCGFPDLCDTQRGRRTEFTTTDVSSMKDFTLQEDVASKLEETYVHEVYQKISDHFSETRHKPWPNVMEFVGSFPIGSVLLDVGCGNGKYFSKESHSYEMGCDISSDLMRVCRDRGFECFSCNCLHVPVRDNAVDGCISIAVIHHLVTEERRRRAITEMVRVLRPKGRALIYVWAKNQERLNEKSSYLKQRSRKKTPKEGEGKKTVALNECANGLVLPVHVNRTNFDHNDLLVPWKLKDKNTIKSSENVESPVYLRYYHVFDDDELKEMCSSLNNVEVVDYYYDQGNWCIALQKQ